MSYNIADLTSQALSNALSKEKVEKVVVFILENNSKTSPENTMSTNEIKDAYKKLKSQNPEVVDIPDSTITTTISILSSNSTSRIQCPGKKQGYFVTPEVPATESKEESANILNGKLLEKDLYPVLIQWMNVSFDMRCIDISNKRANEKWRNPDILGIKELDFLGDSQFEITTVEVKPDKRDWTMYIFEAVSHSMFSNRTYFAYLKDSFYEKIQDEMKLYASQFGIGIISIAIDDEEKSKINNRERLLKALEDGTCQIKEEVPAPYHVPDVNLQKRFLDGLNIQTKNQLRNFS